MSAPDELAGDFCDRCAEMLRGEEAAPGAVIECGACGLRYHEGCWFPGCVAEACTNEYDYRVVAKPGDSLLARPLERAGGEPRGPSIRLGTAQGAQGLEAALAPTTRGGSDVGPMIAALVLFGLAMGFCGSEALWLVVGAAGVIAVVGGAKSTEGPAPVEAWELELDSDAIRVVAPERGAYLLRPDTPGLRFQDSVLSWTWGEETLSLRFTDVSSEREHVLRDWIRATAKDREASLVVLCAREAQTCPLCRDALLGDEGSCSGCETPYHASCWDELGGCALPSCRSLAGLGRYETTLRDRARE